jgi:very-short-patch-repair endonuclease
MEMKQITIGGKTIRVFTTESGEIWICGKDVASALGYRNTTDALIKHAPEGEKVQLSQICTSESVNNPSTLRSVFITPKGVQCLLSKTRIPGYMKLGNQLAHYFEFELNTIHHMKKEAEYIGHLMDVFDIYNPLRQYAVETYRVDLYLEKINIVVECDEEDHKGRCPVYEKAREEIVLDVLDCSMVRFNPDHPEFSVFSVIKVIHRLVVKVKPPHYEYIRVVRKSS